MLLHHLSKRTLSWFCNTSTQLTVSLAVPLSYTLQCQQMQHTFVWYVPSLKQAIVIPDPLFQYQSWFEPNLSLNPNPFKQVYFSKRLLQKRTYNKTSILSTKLPNNEPSGAVKSVILATFQLTSETQKNENNLGLKIA